MKKIIFILLINLTVEKCQSQNDSQNCLALIAVVSSNDFIERFDIGNKNNIHNELILVDTSNYFLSCQLPDISARKLRLTAQYPHGISITNADKESASSIILYEIAKQKRTIMLSMWQPYTNAMLRMCVLLRKNKVAKVKVVAKGYF